MCQIQDHVLYTQECYVIGATFNLLFQVKPTVYFHIKNNKEVKLVEATGADRVTLPVDDRFTYYRTECTYPEVSNCNCNTYVIKMLHAYELEL